MFVRGQDADEWSVQTPDRRKVVGQIFAPIVRISTSSRYCNILQSETMCHREWGHSTTFNPTLLGTGDRDLLKWFSDLQRLGHGSRDVKSPSWSWL